MKREIDMSGNAKMPKQFFCSFLAVIGENCRKDDFIGLVRYLPRYRLEGQMYEMEGLKLAVFSSLENRLQRIIVRRSAWNMLFLQGDFYEEITESSVDDLLQTTSEGCEDKLKYFLRSLNGIFSGFTVDLMTGECRAFMNQFGFTFLYLTKQDSVVWLSSHIWPMMRIQQGQQKISQEALQDTLLLGYPVGNRTLMSDVYTVQPRTMVSISASGYREEEYFRPAERITMDVGEASRRFSLACNEHFDYMTNLFSPDHFVATITGGHDTRVTLNALLKNNIRPICLVGSGWPIKMSTDARRAKLVARTAGCEVIIIDYDSAMRQHDADFFVFNDGELSRWIGNLGVKAGELGNVTYYGFSGDVLSGSCGIQNITDKSFDSLVTETFFSNYEYETDPRTLVKILFGIEFDDVLQRYAETFTPYKDHDPYTMYLYQRLMNRNFRRIGYFAGTAKIGSVPVSLFHDKRVADLYLSLPRKLLEHQKFQCVQGYAELALLGWIPASNWPIPLLMEAILLDCVRRPSLILRKWMRSYLHHRNGRMNSYIETKYNQAMTCCREAGILDEDTLNMLKRVEKQGAIGLTNRIMATAKMIRIMKGATVEEIEVSGLFPNDLFLKADSASTL